MNSAMLAVGTELTDGQILNRNSAWLAERMKALGARTVAHLSVADDRRAILDGLSFCAERAQYVFVTGGLGPTSDDFTRDLIAEWSSCPLEFHEPSWQAVHARLSARGFAVQEFQKQQCYFPRGARVLTNSQGTANGFWLSAKGRELIVLPGPPREVAAIWDDHLAASLGDLCRELDPIVTRSWDTIGLGESQIAAMTEPLLTGFDVEAGYRVHLPYVEFKLTFPQSRAEALAPLLARTEETLRACTVSRDGVDLAESLALRLANLPSSAPLTIIDELTGSYLLRRIETPFRTVWSSHAWSIRSQGPPPESGSVLWIRPVDEHTARIGLRHEGQTRESWFEAPMRAPLMNERRKQYFVEIALAFWWGQLFP